MNLPNMIGFKSSRDLGRECRTQEKSLGTKNYFSRKTMDSNMHSSSFSGPNDHLSKYRNLSLDGKNFEKAKSTSNIYIRSKDETEAGPSSLSNQFEQRSNSISSHSTSFVKDYARVSSKHSDKKLNMLNDSWKSDTSLVRGFNYSMLSRGQEGGGITKMDYFNNLIGNFDKGKTDAKSRSVNSNVSFENIDTSIAPDLNSEDEDEDIPELRSAPDMQHSIIELNKSYSMMDEQNKKTEVEICSPVLDQGSNHSDMSDLFINRPNYIPLQRLSEKLEKVPLPNYSSDDSIVDDSQPKERGNIILPKRSSESLRSSSEKFLSDKITPTQLSSSSNSPDFFVSNKYNKVSDQSRKLLKALPGKAKAALVLKDGEKTGFLESYEENVQKPYETKQSNLKDTCNKNKCNYDLNNREVSVGPARGNSNLGSLDKITFLEDPAPKKSKITGIYGDTDEKTNKHPLKNFTHTESSRQVNHNSNSKCKGNNSDYQREQKVGRTPSNEQFHKFLKSSSFSLSQSSAFKPAHPASKHVLDTQASSGIPHKDKRMQATELVGTQASCGISRQDKRMQATELVDTEASSEIFRKDKRMQATDISARSNLYPRSEIKCGGAKLVRGHDPKPSTSGAFAKRQINLQLSDEEIKPPEKKQFNLNKIVNNGKKSDLIRPIVIVDNNDHSNSKLNLKEDTIFQPITHAPVVEIKDMPQRLSMRSTDGSSKMELEQIFHHCYHGNVAEGTGKGGISRKDTPFVHSNSSFIDKNVKIVKDSHPLGENVGSFFPESPVELVSSSNCLNSNNNTNKIDSSKHESSRLTIPASSGSESSILSPVINTGGSQPLNFTRLINTDANNNTLQDRKDFLKTYSPTVLHLKKNSKTYLRKNVNKPPNHCWFQTANRKPCMSSLQNIKKKKLFHLPSNYQESVTSDDGGIKVNQRSELSKLKKSSRKTVQKIPQLYDIEEPGKSNQEIKTQPRVDDEIISQDASCIRRSVRSRKRINYKEVSDTETEKSSCLQNGRSSSAMKTTIKNLILKNSNQSDSVPSQIPGSSGEEKKGNLFKGKTTKTCEGSSQNEDIKSKTKKASTTKNSGADIVSSLFDDSLNTQQVTHEVKSKGKFKINVQNSYKSSNLLVQEKNPPQSSNLLVQEKNPPESSKNIFDFDISNSSNKTDNKMVKVYQKSNTRRGVSHFKKGRENNTSQKENRKKDSNLKRTHETSRRGVLNKTAINEYRNKNEAKSDRMSPSCSVVMETIVVEAAVHQSPQPEQSEKCKTIISPAVKPHHVIEELSGLCDEGNVLSNHQPCKTTSAPKNPSANLNSLMKSIKRHIDGINADFGMLTDILNH